MHDWGTVGKHMVTLVLRAFKDCVFVNYRGAIGAVAGMTGRTLHNHMPPLPVLIVRGSAEKSTTLTTGKKKNYNVETFRYSR
jgi:hypothetical protein